MMAADFTISLGDVLREATVRPSRFMWFLGAGASRSAMMRTAKESIWELKLRQYCLEVRQDVRHHDLPLLDVRREVREGRTRHGNCPKN